MMPPHLQQRFDQLLGFAKDPQYFRIARENIAAAGEMVDTLLSCSQISIEDYKAYQAQVMAARLVISGAEMARASGARISTKPHEYIYSGEL